MSVQLESEIGTAKLGDLRSRFRGVLIRPGDEAYAETRRVWNGAIDRWPALIARCADADDVVTALRFARELGLPISVRGSGHGVAGQAVCDGGLMIDWPPVDRDFVLTLDDLLLEDGRIAPFSRTETSYAAMGRSATSFWWPATRTCT